MRYPMAYHITWGTYGARLPGSSKPYVDRGHNEYETPLPKPDPAREQAARDRMRGEPVALTLEQRQETERALEDVARRYNWTIHTKAAQSDHVHVVITAIRDGEQLRDALKACACRALNKKFGAQQWWAEKGSCRYLWERSYFINAKNYVEGQRDF